MSLENVRSFIEAASQDQALQERLAGHEPAEALRLAVEAGAERGLPFTHEEFVAGIRTMAQENIPNANTGELSPSELNQVAGGVPVAVGLVVFLAGFVGAAGGNKYADEIATVGAKVVEPVAAIKPYLK